jgi:hypothetical protein
MGPHWVHAGGDYAISIAKRWRTPEVVRMNKIRLMNGTLRRYGLPQHAPGISPGLGQLKVFTHDKLGLCLIRCVKPMLPNDSSGA